jgi:hypothetical protein
MQARRAGLGDNGATLAVTCEIRRTLNNFAFTAVHTKAGGQRFVRLEISKAGQHQPLFPPGNFFRSPAAPSSTRQITDSGHHQQVQSRCECPNATYRPISRPPGRPEMVHGLIFWSRVQSMTGSREALAHPLSVTPSQTALDQQSPSIPRRTHLACRFGLSMRKCGRLTCLFSAAQGQLGYPEAPRGRCPRLW